MSTTIAIAGLGAAARQIHLPAYAKLGELRVVGGYDPALSAKSVARGSVFPFPLYSSAEELLNQTQPDIFAVITPPKEHFELIRLGLSAGCHVLCEKPFVSTDTEAAEVVRLSRAANRWVVVNNQYRFMNIHRAARRELGGPKFGELLFVNVQQSFRTSPQTEAGWRGQEARRTCQEFGTHVFDLCRYFFDEDPIAIRARMPRASESNGPDLLNLIQLEFSRDRIAQICLNRLSRGRHRYLDIRLDGSVGSIETHLGGGIALGIGLRGGTRRPFANFDFSLGGRARIFHGEKFRKIASDPLDVFPHATSRLVDAFLQALRNGESPPCHAEDNRRTLALMLAAYDSDEKKTTIKMSY